MSHDGTPYQILHNIVGGNQVLYSISVVLLFVIYILLYYAIFFFARKKNKQPA